MYAKSFAFHSAYTFGSPLYMIGSGMPFKLSCHCTSIGRAFHSSYHSLDGLLELTLKPSHDFHGLGLLRREHLRESVKHRFSRGHGLF